MKVCQEDTLPRLIYLTSQEMSNFLEKVLSPYDLTLEQFHILKHMEPSLGMSQRQIGEIVNKTAANITRILDRMEAKSLVVRRDNPEDRRASLVFLTEKGHALLKEVFGNFEKFSADLVQGITEKEQQIVRKTMAKMTSNLQRMSELLGNINKQ